MKKYELHKIEENEYLGTFASKQEAVEFMLDFIEERNEDLDSDDEEYLTAFDFRLEEVEVEEINEIVSSFDDACAYLNGKLNNGFTVSKKILSGNCVHPADVSLLVKEVNPKHIDALIAMNELFTIAQAWNKADNFVPDFSDSTQCKYFPCFVYDKEVAGFVFANTNHTATYVSATIGSRLCFKTGNRAMQFGKQFAHLYNQVFLLDK